ncbi:hypothetical protein GCM10010971_26780 [Silvimonas amylolytica]|uniref:Uncharacterized protein n=1 Tax=Silvimonas amylolytica TaxID=449663 RepID=A0ABQ2PNM5_9NEIS|nr:hypothetical protein GCM10010971_26780 [Silvimonas amylolytica]
MEALGFKDCIIAGLHVAQACYAEGRCCGLAIAALASDPDFTAPGSMPMTLIVENRKKKTPPWRGLFLPVRPVYWSEVLTVYPVDNTRW